MRIGATVSHTAQSGSVATGQTPGNNNELERCIQQAKLFLAQKKSFPMLPAPSLELASISTEWTQLNGAQTDEGVFGHKVEELERCIQQAESLLAQKKPFSTLAAPSLELTNISTEWTQLNRAQTDEGIFGYKVQQESARSA